MKWWNDTAGEDQRCAFEIMIGARKISLCRVYLWEEVASERSQAKLKRTCIMSTRRRRYFATFLPTSFSYRRLLISEIQISRRENVAFPCERRPFFFFAAVLANARVSLWIIERGIQCTVCIVEVSKDLCHRQLYQNGHSVFPVPTVLA